MATLDPEGIRSLVQVCLTAIFVAAAFAVLLLGAGQEGTARLAAGWLGAVLGFLAPLSGAQSESRRKRALAAPAVRAGVMSRLGSERAWRAKPSATARR